MRIRSSTLGLVAAAAVLAATPASADVFDGNLYSVESVNATTYWGAVGAYNTSFSTTWYWGGTACSNYSGLSSTQTQMLTLALVNSKRVRLWYELQGSYRCIIGFVIYAN